MTTNKNLIVFGIIILLICVGLSGCTEQTSTSTAVNIKTFMSVKEGDLTRFYFLLEDINSQNTVSDGHVEIIIYDVMDHTLYNDEFDVSSSDFVDYEFQLTGTGIGKAYEWRIETSDIEKSYSRLEWGRALLTFVTSEGGSMSAEYELVEIPIYNEEEIETIQEELYDENAVSFNEKITKGNFEVTVNKAGFFYKY